MDLAESFSELMLKLRCIVNGNLAVAVGSTFCLLKIRINKGRPKLVSSALETAFLQNVIPVRTLLHSGNTHPQEVNPLLTSLCFGSSSASNSEPFAGSVAFRTQSFSMSEVAEPRKKHHRPAVLGPFFWVVSGVCQS